MSENGDLFNEKQLAQQFMKFPKSEMKESDKLKDWVIYCKKRGKGRIINQQQEEQVDYSKDLEQVGTFSTLKQFFGYFTSIKQPSALQIDTKIFYFLKGCKPLWQQWLNSGCLLITIKYKNEQKDQLGARLLNSTWEYLLFSLIGNNLPKPRKNHNNKNEKSGKQLIIGLVLQRRQKISLIQVWYRDQLHTTQLTRLLKEDLQEHLKFSSNQKTSINIKYKKHKESISSNSTLKGASFNMATIGALGTALSMQW